MKKILFVFALFFITSCDFVSNNSLLPNPNNERIILGDTVEVEEGENAVFNYQIRENEILHSSVEEGTLLVLPIEAKNSKGETLSNTMIFQALGLDKEQKNQAKIKFYTTDKATGKTIKVDYGFIKIKKRLINFATELDEFSIFENKELNETKALTLFQGESLEIKIKEEVKNNLSFKNLNEELFLFEDNKITGLEKGEGFLEISLNNAESKKFSVKINII